MWSYHILSYRNQFNAGVIRLNCRERWGAIIHEEHEHRIHLATFKFLLHHLQKLCIHLIKYLTTQADRQYACPFAFDACTGTTKISSGYEACSNQIWYLLIGFH